MTLMKAFWVQTIPAFKPVREIAQRIGTIPQPVMTWALILSRQMLPIHKWILFIQRAPVTK
jgi:hypothetical protein